MKRLLTAVVGIVVLAGLGFGGFAVFEHFDHAGKIKDATKSCSGLDNPTSAASLPTGFALPSDQTLLRVENQGKTDIVYASVAGQRADLVHLRDSVATFLSASGYAVKHKDQEPTYEADAGLSKGGVDDSINVRPLCSGRAVVRYTLHQ